VPAVILLGLVVLQRAIRKCRNSPHLAELRTFIKLSSKTRFAVDRADKIVYSVRILSKVLSRSTARSLRPGCPTPLDREFARTAPSQSSDPNRKLRHLRLLVVDDDEDCREILVTILSAHGALVSCAANAVEGLIKFQEKPPDVLISDIGMPGIDGYEFIRNVRCLSDVGGGKVPAIALTAYSRIEDRDLALNAGFTLHMSKPVDLQRLVAAVLEVIAP